MATNLPFTNLDFDEVKNNLKEYLQGQDQFEDYNFEGSNINVLLDILAYNTFHNNFYTNMAISEMFLDSAELKNSVVSHAKELNYLPRSRRSARVNSTISFSPSDTPASISIPRRTKFNARCGTETYTFYNDESLVIIPSAGSYTSDPVTLYEGKYFDEFYRVDSTQTQRFTISNKDVDTTSIRVFIKENVNSTTETEYVYKQNIYGVNSTDTVFYLQPYLDDKYEIIFGQNTFGADVENGNVIRIEYRTTNGVAANGISQITLANRIDGYTGSVTVSGRTTSGAERESLESIKYFAPKSIQVQNRAVSARDYEILIKNTFPEIKSLAVFGGETLTPPQFGRVVIAVDAVDADGVSTNTKDLIAEYLSDKTSISIEPIIIDSKYMFLSVTSTIYYNQNFTRKSRGDIASAVTNAITQYSFNNLEDYNENFKYSDFTTAIDNSDEYITSNDTRVVPLIEIFPRRNFSNYFILQYGNAIQANLPYVETSLNSYVPAIYSTSFTYGGQSVFLQDNGTGNLNIVRRNSTGNLIIVQRNVGTVDYTTGDVVLTYITIQDYPATGIQIYANTVGKKITAPRDRILQIRSRDIQTSITGVRE